MLGSPHPSRQSSSPTKEPTPPKCACPSLSLSHFHPITRPSTHPTSLADLTDVDFFLGSLDATLFPGISSSIQVHSGFRDEQASTAPTILAAVQKTIAAHGAKKVTVTGHSLGAALALLDGVYLPLHVGVEVEVVGYGTPRVRSLDDVGMWMN